MAEPATKFRVTVPRGLILSASRAIDTARRHEIKTLRYVPGRPRRPSGVQARGRGREGRARCGGGSSGGDVRAVASRACHSALHGVVHASWRCAGRGTTQSTPTEGVSGCHQRRLVFCVSTRAPEACWGDRAWRAWRGGRYACTDSGTRAGGAAAQAGRSGRQRLSVSRVGGASPRGSRCAHKRAPPLSPCPNGGRGRGARVVFTVRSLSAWGLAQDRAAGRLSTRRSQRASQTPRLPCGILYPNPAMTTYHDC